MDLDSTVQENYSIRCLSVRKSERQKLFLKISFTEIDDSIRNLGLNSKKKFYNVVYNLLSCSPAYASEQPKRLHTIHDIQSTVKAWNQEFFTMFSRCHICLKVQQVYFQQLFLFV
jgi:hypothetical protein